MLTQREAIFIQMQKVLAERLGVEPDNVEWGTRIFGDCRAQAEDILDLNHQIRRTFNLPGDTFLLDLYRGRGEWFPHGTLTAPGIAFVRTAVPSSQPPPADTSQTSSTDPLTVDLLCAYVEHTRRVPQA